MGWQTTVACLVRRHAFDFEAAGAEIGVEARLVREEFARQEFGAAQELEEPAEQLNASTFFEEQHNAKTDHESKREEVFERVLKCLGGGASRPLPESRVVEAWREQRAAEAAEEAKTYAVLAERAEMKKLAADRETLRRRFEPGSVDGIGEDPLAVNKSLVEPPTSLQLDTSGLDEILDAIEADYADRQCSDDLRGLFDLMDYASSNDFPQELDRKCIAVPPEADEEVVVAEPMDTFRCQTSRPSNLATAASTTPVPAKSSSTSKACLSRRNNYRMDTDQDSDDDDEDWRAQRFRYKQRADKC